LVAGSNPAGRTKPVTRKGGGYFFSDAASWLKLRHKKDPRIRAANAGLVFIKKPLLRSSATNPAGRTNPRPSQRVGDFYLGPLGLHEMGRIKIPDFRYAEAGFSFYKKAPYQEQRS